MFDGLNPVQESSGSTVLANILPGLRIDEFLTRTDVVAGVTSNFLTDALGSPVAVTDTTGTVQTEYTYEPFGKTTFSGASNSSSYQYTGRENDGTGLYYYRARYYHPALQRFIGEDPLRFRSGDFNLFAYVSNNPVRFIDPLGLDKGSPGGPGRPGGPGAPKRPGGPGNPSNGASGNGPMSADEADQIIKDLQRYEDWAKMISDILSQLLDYTYCAARGSCFGWGSIIGGAVGDVVGVPTGPSDLVKATIDFLNGGSPIDPDR